MRCRFDFNLTDIGFALTEMSLKQLTMVRKLFFQNFEFCIRFN